MKNEFSKAMASHSDEQLVRILTTDREKYQPLAIDAAELELEKRGINKDEFETIKEKTSIDKHLEQKTASTAAGSWLRFVNLLIDSVIWSFLAFMVAGFYFMFMPDHASDLFFYCIAITIFMGYYAITEMIFQKSVGKFITRTKVVNLKGEKPEYNDVIVRTFCRLIPFDRISFLFSKNGIHDYLSKTMVIKDKTN